eukprot:2740470-Alexandrium_andersonii.AAC.1
MERAAWPVERARSAASLGRSLRVHRSITELPATPHLIHPELGSGQEHPDIRRAERDRIPRTRTPGGEVEAAR